MSETLRRRLPLFGALALSTVVVVTAFDPVPHSGGDNAGYLALAHGLLVNGSYTDAFDPEGLPHTKYPPVFPLLLAILMWAGARSWVAFKAVAAASTVAAVGFTFAWAERRLDTASAFAVAILLATAAAVVYYSHWILSDPLFLALTLASLLALERGSADDELDVRWIACGVVAALLAFFTRSAGLPLVVAILGWLALRRRWRLLAATGLVVGIPGFAWWWRGRGVGVASYAQEFWMADPYQPALGTIGVGGLVPRAIANLEAYVVSHGPAGLVGQGGGAWLPLLGAGLALVAVGGWVLSARERIGPAELFFPLYAGLILLWPEVWAGDRFALPLYPLMFVYAAVALRELGARMPGPVAGALAAAAILAVLLPAGAHWLEGSRRTSECARFARTAGPFACYGPGVGSFVEAAVWMGDALPEGAVVLSRKPRHFYLLSGLRSRTFPFEEDPAAHLSLADALGARYVLLDQWDGLAARYAGAAVRARPGGFCYLRGFGDPASGGAQLLGIRTPRARSSHAQPPGAPVQLASCPADYLRVDGGEESSESSASSWRIPLLVDLGS